jgi:hypothetical protein
MALLHQLDALLDQPNHRQLCAWNNEVGIDDITIPYECSKE